MNDRRSPGRCPEGHAIQVRINSLGRPYGYRCPDCEHTGRCACGAVGSRMQPCQRCMRVGRIGMYYQPVTSWWQNAESLQRDGGRLDPLRN